MFFSCFLTGFFFLNRSRFCFNVFKRGFVFVFPNFFARFLFKFFLFFTFFLNPFFFFFNFFAEKGFFFMIFQKNKDFFRENYKQKMERGSKEKFFLNRMCSLSSLFFEKNRVFSFEISFFLNKKGCFSYEQSRVL